MGPAANSSATRLPNEAAFANRKSQILPMVANVNSPNFSGGANIAIKCIGRWFHYLAKRNRTPALA